MEVPPQAPSVLIFRTAVGEALVDDDLEVVMLAVDVVAVEEVVACLLLEVDDITVED